MTNINFKVVGTANVSQMQGSFGKLEAQIASVNAQLASMVNLQKGVDGAGFQRMAQAAAVNDKAFRAAIASTGMFEQMQLRVNRATDDYVKKLNAQKLSFRDLIKQRKIAAAAYKEQLAMENMMVRTSQNANARGKQLLDVTYAKEVSSELDTMSRRLGFFNEQLKSGAHQMVNWGKNTQWAGRQLTVGFTMPIAAAGAAAGVLAYQVDKEFTRISKVYDTTANSMSTATRDQIAVEKELKQLREDGTATAIKAAREYGFAVTDTLKAQGELAATGQTGVDLQKATAEVMRISRLGEMDYQDTLKATISLQSVFKMSTKELGDAFNYMNSIENATSLTTQDFAEAIPIAAAPVKAFGGDIKELGILLTAMKSRGIEATEGANAIKAAMQRLGRPSKQIREEWQALTNTDIKTIFNEATSLQDLFIQIGNATKDLSDKDRIRAFAGLFGTYQVTRMTAMVEGLKDIQLGFGQTADAAEIAGQTTEQWAKTAETEIKRYQNSVAGQWETSFQELKGQMATLGEPFVEIATVVIKSVSNIIDVFNSLPSPVKKGVAILLGLAAVAGPLVMLTGLFANLMGHSVKMGASLVGLAVKMNVLDAESRAAQIANELLNTTFIDEKTAVQQLTAEINKMALAQAEANKATTQAIALASGRTGVPANGTLWLQAKADKDRKKNTAATAENVAATARDSDKIAVANGKISRHGKIIATSTALGAASMATMAVSSNSALNNMAQLALTASMVVPAVTTVAPLLMKGATAAGTQAKNLFSSVKAAGGLSGGLRAAGVAINGMLGPIGWISLAVSAVGFGLYKWYQHSEATRREQELIAKATSQSQADILSMTKQWADETGRAWNNYIGYNAEGQKDYRTKKQIAYMNMVDQLSNQETTVTNAEGEKKTVKRVAEFNKMSDTYKQFALADMLREAVVEMGMSVDEARMYLTAFLDAAGTDITSAGKIVDGVIDDIGTNIKSMNWSELIRLANEALIDAAGDPIVSKAIAEKYGNQVGTAMAEGSPEAAKKVVTGLSDSITQQWDAQRQALISYFNERGGIEALVTENFYNSGRGDDIEGQKKAIAFFKNMTSSVEEFKAAMKEGIDVDSLLATNGAGNEPVHLQFEKFTEELNKNYRALSQNESGIVSQIAKINGLSDDVRTVNDLLDDWRVKLITLDKAGRTNELMRPGGLMETFQRELKRVESMNVLGGLFGAKDYKGDVNYLLGIIEQFTKAGIDMSKLDQKTKDWLASLEQAYNIDIPGVGREVKKVAGDYTIRFKIQANKDMMIDSLKTAMTSVQEQIADSYRSAFEERMNASMEARQNFWDRQGEAQQAAFDRQDKALEAKWERKKDAATRYWDARIKKVNEAIEAEKKAEDDRKKMFDAEMDRISRLNDAMNKNIDFNVALNEGRLDEAAKIRNDVFAEATKTALGNAKEAGSARSDARVERLQGRAEVLGVKRDDYMKQLDKRADAEKAHLKRVQDIRSRALKKRSEADLAALRKSWDAEKKNLDQRLSLFMNYIARNEKDLAKHMARVGLSYDKFGKNVLHPKAKEWGNFYGDAMRNSLKATALKLESDAMWKRLGKKSADEIAKGMGFMNMKHFEFFMNTGKMKMDNGRPYPGFIGPVKGETRHTGGFIGDGLGSRKGVAKTTRGLHPTEKIVRAQKGEFMVNKKDAQRNADLLTRINNGETFGTDVGVGGISAAALPMAYLAKGLMAGMGRAMQSARKQKEQEMTSGMYTGPMGSRRYSLPGVKPWVFEAAQYLGNKFNISTILGVGSRGNVSEHPLGRALDFMTSDDRGTALANEVVRLHGALDAMYVIWRQRINSFDGRGWRTMEDRGSPTANHMDHVHVSFNSTGKTGDLPNLGAAVNAGAFKQGTGGTHRPVRGGVITQGIHYNNAIDFGVPRGTPVYSYADGVVTSSRDIRGPLSTDRYRGDGPYGSYGRVIEINHGKFSTLYAHLSQRYAKEGQMVKGGATIGLSGNTGNSSGPHLHFGMPGGNPRVFLKSGGTIKKDGTPAVLHKDERVLTAPLTKKLDTVVDALYRGVGVGGIGGKKKEKHWQPAFTQHWKSAISSEPKPKKKKKATPFNYPAQMASAANRPHTWFNYDSVENALGITPTGKSSSNVNQKAFSTTIATLNAHYTTSAAKTITDMKRLMNMADVVTLTEMSRKFGPVGKYLSQNGWGLFSGNVKNPLSKSSSIAYNRDKYNFMKGGTRLLGKTKGNFGGGHLRWANYALLQDKASGSKMWQVAAHTVPKPFLSKKRTRLFEEQWAGLNGLVQELRKTGYPVFMSGDMNNRKGLKLWRTPDGMNSAHGRSVDWIFNDPRMSRFLSGANINGMHTDHPGAYLARYNIPSLSKGAMDVRFDDTLANLHRGEAVLTRDLNAKFKQGVDNFANGGGNVYDIDVHITEPAANADQIANTVIKKIERQQGRKPGSRRQP